MPSPVDPYDYGGDDDGKRHGIEIIFTFTNRIPVNLFTRRAQRYARQCPIAYEFIVAYLANMGMRKRKIEQGIRQYIPEVSGRLRASVYVSQFLLSGVPLMNSRLVYAGVEFGADSRRSRNRRRIRPAHMADNLADAMLSYVRGPEFGNIVEAAAREAVRQCTTPPGRPG